MQINFFLLTSGSALALYGGAIVFSSRAAAYLQKVSIDKHWMSPHMAEFSLRYVEATATLGLGMALILAAFVH